jgi:hypothetical protein
MRESEIFLHNGRNYTTVQRITESVEKPLRKEQPNKWQLVELKKYDQQRKGITTENNSGLSLNDLFIFFLYYSIIDPIIVSKDQSFFYSIFEPTIK